jgi:hypothetical protein
MKKEIAEQWVAALRSGKYQQGRGALHDGDTFCCLGVLCDLFPGRQWSRTADDTRHACYAGPGTEIAVLPKDVQLWAGLSAENPSATDYDTIAELNDGEGFSGGPWSFRRIANLIEEKWEDL